MWESCRCHGYVKDHYKLITSKHRSVGLEPQPKPATTIVSHVGDGGAGNLHDGPMCGQQYPIIFVENTALVFFGCVEEGPFAGVPIPVSRSTMVEGPAQVRSL